MPSMAEASLQGPPWMEEVRRVFMIKRRLIKEKE